MSQKEEKVDVLDDKLCMNTISENDISHDAADCDRTVRAATTLLWYMWLFACDRMISPPTQSSAQSLFVIALKILGPRSSSSIFSHPLL